LQTFSNKTHTNEQDIQTTKKNAKEIKEEGKMIFLKYHRKLVKVVDVPTTPTHA
jgi:hypothetical protein